MCVNVFSSPLLTLTASPSMDRRQILQQAKNFIDLSVHESDDDAPHFNTAVESQGQRKPMISAKTPTRGCNSRRFSTPVRYCSSSSLSEDESLELAGTPAGKGALLTLGGLRSPVTSSAEPPISRYTSPISASQSQGGLHSSRYRASVDAAGAGDNSTFATSTYI